jgi:hypothetical protein
MPKSYYLSNIILDSALRSQAFTVPTAAYLALFTVMPTAGGGGTEVSGGAYSRQIVVFSPPVNGVSSNTADVTYSIATVPWGTVVGFGVYDNSSGGNLLYFNTLSSPRNVQINDQLRFPVGQLQASEQ